MSEAEPEVEGFDPAEDPASSPNKMHIKDAFEKELNRGNEERAAEIRQAPGLQEQLRLAQNAGDFDPRYDDCSTSSQIAIRNTYDALKDAGLDDEADELRHIGSLRGQRERARELRETHDITAIQSQ